MILLKLAAGEYDKTTNRQSWLVAFHRTKRSLRFFFFFLQSLTVHLPPLFSIQEIRPSENLIITAQSRQKTFCTDLLQFH